MSTNIFSDVRYYVSLTLRSEYREQLDTVLDAAGATAVTVDDPSLTHFITNSLPNDDALEALPEDTTAHLVTPTWVERSRILDAPQPPEYYSPDPAHLFSGVTATATDLSASDRELMYASITALGGQWRSALTRDVTHVFALVPGSQKYETAMHFRAQTGMLVLVPHWHDDTIRLGVRGLPTAEYEWPEPAVFKGDWSVKKEGAAPGDLPKPYRITGEKKPFFDTALVQGNDLPVTRAPTRNLWNGLRILLAVSLQLSHSQREAHEEDIRREGGLVVPLDLTKQGAELVDEVNKVEEADIYVTAYRSGPAFVKAYRDSKTIGTLPWLWYCRAIGTISHPTDQLIHFPIPRKPIEGFSKHSITITNYTGKHRDYLKKLILLMGAEFTASMSPKNTVVVAAYFSGTKTEKASSWSIPVVNHTWLEDCFTQWRALTPAQERYITFPPRLDFSELISARPTGGKVILEPAELDALAQEGLDDTPESEGDRKPRSAKEIRPLVRAAASAGSSAREAEQVAKADTPGEVSLGEFLETDIEVGDARKRAGDDMDVDEQEQEQEREKPRSKGSSPRKYQSKAKTLRRRGAARQDEDEDEGEEARPSTSRAVERQKRTSASTRLLLTSDSDSDSDVEMDADSPLKGKTNKAVRSNNTSAKGKGSSKKVAPPKSSGDEDVMDIDTPVKAKSKPKGKTVQPKIGPPKAARKRPKPDSSSEDEQPTGEPSHAPRSAAKSSRSAIPESVAPESPAAKPKPARAPRKAVAVVVPTVAAAYADAGAGASSAKKALGRKQSVRAAARESPASPGKRGRITREKEDANLGTPEKEGPGPVAAATPGTVQRTPSRRAAASKATRRLHEEIMPDVVNFQKQLKNGAVKGAWESDVREGASEKSKGKKRASDGDAGALSVDEEQRPEKKRQRTGAAKEGKTQGRQSGKSAREEEEDEGEASDTGGARSRAKPASKGKSASSRSQEVRVMTTQITISDEVTKFLKKMGVQMTTKPAECTHLVARNLVRTEKFLCAIARAPHILNEKWLLASYAAKELLPEDTFVLKDPVNEEKFGFKLADALQRAKANAGKLFAGHTFYVTPHVPVDSKLLKNVVAACGGALSTQTPTARVLAGHAERHVVSCPEDRSIWRPVAQAGHQVYNQELILTSALKQEVEWEKEAYLLATDE